METAVKLSEISNGSALEKIDTILQELVAEVNASDNKKEKRGLVVTISMESKQRGDGVWMTDVNVTVKPKRPDVPVGCAEAYMDRSTGEMLFDQPWVPKQEDLPTEGEGKVRILQEGA